jgi:hypothetical protein
MDTKKNPWLLLSLLFLGLSVNNHLSLGADTISANQSLSGDQTIVSSGGNFVLGFFKPGSSSNYYIGMWYGTGKVSTQTIVWVANRDKPVSDKSSSVLRISDGNLVLFNESQIPVWSTNLTSTTSSSPVQAVLQDEGNLVLKDRSNSSQHLWQSFDHPAHTWLPGSKLGLNKISNQNQRLVSWKNEEDPAPGLFSLELQANTSEFIILWNRSILYWTTGAWDGKMFSLVPDMIANYIYNLFNISYVNNTNESYFTYSLYDPSIFSQLVMDVSGKIQQKTWLSNTNEWNLIWTLPKTQCEVYDFCGAFGTCNEESMSYCSCLKGFVAKSQNDRNLPDYAGGCMRRTPLQCKNTNLTNGHEDRFLPIPSMVLPAQRQSIGVGSAAECESTCLNNCSCTAYAYTNASNYCSVWFGDLLNLQQLSGDDPNGRTLYLKLAVYDFSSKKNNKGMIVGAVAGSVAGVAILLGLFILLMRRRRAVGTGKAVEGSLVAFGYRDLQNATKNFSDKLGGGGFGSVFKGTLSDSTVIAVKKLESISQGEKQFRTEVSTIGTINHVNLVRLRGFCSEGARKLLVYDYMPNGSLESHLFHEKFLDWKTRYQIAIGTARGLYYLHEKCRECIIHCDIKPENILLDAYLCPKVADFALAKLVGREFSRVLTTMRGTRGYLAPEWISGVAITTKVDVYSYGMMLFEFVSGRRISEPSADGKTRFFPTQAASLVAEGGDVLSLLDPRLEGNADVEELTRVCKVACWCIQDDETNRPAMGQIVHILVGVLDVNLAPIPISLQLFADN